MWILYRRHNHDKTPILRNNSALMYLGRDYSGDDSEGSGMNKELMFSSKSNEWETPRDLFEELNAEFCFTLDSCATTENAKCEKFYTLQDDGLSQDWQGETVFCNPPYGRELSKWIKKCFEEAQKPETRVVMLIPARTDTKAFHEYILGKGEIRFIKGQLKFNGHKYNAPFPSMVVVFGAR